jgi:hypothetical protein
MSIADPPNPPMPVGRRDLLEDVLHLHRAVVGAHDVERVRLAAHAGHKGSRDHEGACRWVRPCARGAGRGLRPGSREAMQAQGTHEGVPCSSARERAPTLWTGGAPA